MMLKRFPAAIAIAALPLMACNSDPKVEMENASVADVQNKVAQAQDSGSFVKPGKWQAKANIEEISMPGMPPEMAEKMKSMAGLNQTHTNCLTEADAKRPKENFFSGVDSACRYDRFQMGGGKINAVMNCKGQGGAIQRMQMAGTYSDNAYSMVLTTDGGGQGPAGSKMRLRVDAKRLGQCDGTEERS